MFQTGSKVDDAYPYGARQAEQIRILAGQAWIGMQECGILPTPDNFELWYMHVSGGNPALSERLSALLGSGSLPTAEQLYALHSSCFVQKSDVAAIADGSEQLEQAAQAMIGHVADNQEALRAYGDALSGLTVRLDQDRSMDGLVRAVTLLTAQTASASERNRILEQQLSSSTSRILKLRQDLAEARQDATTDGLTGLCNRKAFDLRLRRAIMRAKADDGTLALVLLDIDHFKRFNDTYGHRTGDLVLRLVARVVADNVKGRDTAARYGGEEFAIVLTGADLCAGAVVAGQMRALLDGKRLVTKGVQQDYGSVTISAGVAQLRPGDTAANLIERADAALYAAKHLGRNKVCVENQPAVRTAA